MISTLSRRTFRRLCVTPSTTSSHPAALSNMRFSYRYASSLNQSMKSSSHMSSSDMSSSHHDDTSPLTPASTMTVEHANQFRQSHQITIKGASSADFHPLSEFHATPFATPLKKVFTSEKYVTPTPIQAQTWPIILANRDVISIARTGSGKTCGFVLPAIHRILERRQGKRQAGRRNPSVLVMAPTRELSLQIVDEATKYASAVGLTVSCVYGGASKFNQIKELRAGVDIVIGTPGRINDLVNDGALVLRDVHYLVLDEADRMLDMGFEPQIRTIIDVVPEAPARQTIFFSATWPKDVQLLALDFVSQPVLITAGETGALNANTAIQQHISVVRSGEKYNAFMDLILKLRDEHLAVDATSLPAAPEATEKDSFQMFNRSGKSTMPKTIVFMSRKADCDEMADALRNEGVSADSIHGDLSQEKRSRTLTRFRSGNVRVLVATDVAARGLDVKDVEVVVNYDFPSSGLEDYVHRIGRTARGENSGRSYSFLTSQDQRTAKELIALLKRSKQPVPEDLEALAGSSGYNKQSSTGNMRQRRPSASSFYGGNQRPSSSSSSYGGGNRFAEGGRYAREVPQRESRHASSRYDDDAGMIDDGDDYMDEAPRSSRRSSGFGSRFNSSSSSSSFQRFGREKNQGFRRGGRDEDDE